MLRVRLAVHVDAAQHQSHEWMPAGGMIAAADRENFRTSRWQLSGNLHPLCGHAEAVHSSQPRGQTSSRKAGSGRGAALAADAPGAHSVPGQSAGRPLRQSPKGGRGGKSGLHGHTVPDNDRRARAQGKCHREQTAASHLSLPACRESRERGAVRVKGCGKSAPRRRQRRRHGKPHREQDRIGTARTFFLAQAGKGSGIDVRILPSG